MIDFSHIWGKGQLLSFSGLDGQTDYRNGLVLRTRTEAIALDVKQPETAGAVIRFSGSAFDGIDIAGDCLLVHSGDKTSTLVFADAWNVVLEGSWTLENSGELLESLDCGVRKIVATKGFLKPAWQDASVRELVRQRTAFLEKQTLPEGLPEELRGAACKAIAMLKGQVYAPEGQLPCLWSTPDRWPHANMWNWDSVFHSLGMRHICPDAARQFISAVFATQREDGFIAHMMTPYKISDITQPPLLGLAIEAIHASEAAPEWVAGLVPKLTRYLEWIMANRDKDGDGLLEWLPDQHSPHGSDESGMDNSPRFDGPMTLAAVDFNAYLARECEAMSRLQPERREYWLGHHDRICAGLNRFCWDEELGLYVDYDTVAKKRMDVMSSAGFMPLLCGAPSKEQVARMVAHLHNPKTFGTPFRVPSIAACNTAAYKKDMWRGPAWINMNYLIAVGLLRHGCQEEARELMLETCREEARHYRKYGTFFEYYDDKGVDGPPDLLRKSNVPPYEGWETYSQVMFDYGWSGTLYLEMIHLLFA